MPTLPLLLGNRAACTARQRLGFATVGGPGCSSLFLLKEIQTLTDWVPLGRRAPTRRGSHRPGRSSPFHTKALHPAAFCVSQEKSHTLSSLTVPLRQRSCSERLSDLSEAT